MYQDRYFSPNPSVRVVARKLYQQSKGFPIFAPHGHVDPALFTDINFRFGNPVELFIHPDHYVIRTLFANGISPNELGISPKGKFINYDPREVWKLFCSKFYLFRATPSGVWLTDSLSEVFGIDQKLSEETANFTFDSLTEKLASQEYAPRALFERFNIELLATTDSASDSLVYHQKIRSSDWQGNIIPTFRFDPLVHILNPSWLDQIEQLERVTNKSIANYASYINALESQRVFFRQLGALATDFSSQSAYTEELTAFQTDQIFQRALLGKANQVDADRFVAHMLMEMARMSAEDGLVMQFHAGIYRNHNQMLYNQFGADIGGDIPVKTEFTNNLFPLLTKFGNDKDFRMIIFTLDESTYTRELAPLAGHYPALRLGPPWWFNDSVNGITRYLEQVVEIAGLYKTAGFNDDTRGFCSIPARHDLWRRLSANWLAGLLARHIIDEEDATQMMFDLCVGLARKAYQ